MCDCEPLSPYSQTTRRARKPRACSECRLTIAAGEPYDDCRGLGDGHWYQFSICAPCLEVHTLLGEDSCLCFGELLELLDCFGVDAFIPQPAQLSDRATGHALGLLYGRAMQSELDKQMWLGAGRRRRQAMVTS